MVAPRTNAFHAPLPFQPKTPVPKFFNTKLQHYNMPYSLLDHATDALVEVHADTMDGALEDAAYAAVDIMLDRERVDMVETRRISVESDTTHDMLYGWLEEIIYQTVTEGFAVRRVGASYVHMAGRHTVSASLEGEPLDVRRHRFRVEIKAPTYHEMRITCDDGTRMRFLMDL